MALDGPPCVEPSFCIPVRDHAMSEPLLPDLPPALETLALSLYPEPELARRALLAPWPLLRFRSAYDERALWASTAQLGHEEVTRRASFDRMLQDEREPFQRVDQPYFVGPFTSGTLRSPYPELTDSDFWCFVVLHGTEERARVFMEHRLVPGLGFKTTVAYLRAAHRPVGMAKRLLAMLRPPRVTDPRADAYWSQSELLQPVFV